MKRFVAIALFLLANSFAAHVAVLETTRDDVNLLDHKECQFLTDKLRQMAIMELPTTSGYTIMTRENINTMLPPGKSVEECEGSCLVETGKNISADYVAQGRVSHFGSMVTLTVELYETASGKLMSSFAVQSENAEGLLKEIEERSAPLFNAIKEAEKPKSHASQESQAVDEAQAQSQMEKNSVSESKSESVAEQPVVPLKSMLAFNAMLPIENATWDDESINFAWGIALNISYYKFAPTGYSSLFAVSGGYVHVQVGGEYDGYDINAKFGFGYAPVRNNLLLAVYGFLGLDFKYVFLDYYERGSYDESPGDQWALNVILGSRILAAYQLSERVALNLGADVFADAIGFYSFERHGGGTYLVFENVTVAPYVGVAIRF